MAADRKGIGPTTLKHAWNSTTNTHTKYLLVVMYKTLCSVLANLRLEGEQDDRHRRYAGNAVYVCVVLGSQSELCMR